MSIKSIDLKFTSANSVPVERAVVTREEWESATKASDGVAEALANLMASLGGRVKDCGHDFDCVCPEAKAATALAKYWEAKQ